MRQRLSRWHGSVWAEVALAAAAYGTMSGLEALQVVQERLVSSGREQPLLWQLLQQALDGPAATSASHAAAGSSSSSSLLQQQEELVLQARVAAAVGVLWTATHSPRRPLRLRKCVLSEVVAGSASKISKQQQQQQQQQQQVLDDEGQLVVQQLQELLQELQHMRVPLLEDKALAQLLASPITLAPEELVVPSASSTWVMSIIRGAVAALGEAQMSASADGAPSSSSSSSTSSAIYIMDVLCHALEVGAARWRLTTEAAARVITAVEGTCATIASNGDAAGSAACMERACMALARMGQLPPAAAIRHFLPAADPPAGGVAAAAAAAAAAVAAATAAPTAAAAAHPSAAAENGNAAWQQLVASAQQVHAEGGPVAAAGFWSQAMTAAKNQDQAAWLFVQTLGAASSGEQGHASYGRCSISIAACDALLARLGPAEPGSNLSQPAARLALQALLAADPAHAASISEAAVVVAESASGTGGQGAWRSNTEAAAAAVVLKLSSTSQQVAAQALVCYGMDAAAVQVLHVNQTVLPVLLGAWEEQVRTGHHL
jgi:hypothetical protein